MGCQTSKDAVSIDAISKDAVGGESIPKDSVHLIREQGVMAVAAMMEETLEKNAPPSRKMKMKLYKPRPTHALVEAKKLSMRESMNATDSDSCNPLDADESESSFA